ncbi:hypothetical protein [Methylobacterium trifolii]|uniref:Uncharacterized protein n=1 Tax=Methylobacterium trifolii TaxID=1003092 RepID=A0ABQ4TTK4_9HYPH|nr:hypothetical protein [Methylobacterium trifolii]GJE58239.1 hypothetical protein MPOCJGCO_0318 [Methylobacterium trifolii]
MALDVDGYAVLKAVAAAPDAFPDIRADVAKAGRALVVKQLKAKALPLPALRRIRDILGAESFALIVDGLTDAEAKGLVTRLDKHHPDLKAASAAWHRRRIGALADREEPAGKAKAAKNAKAPAAEKAPKAERALGSRPFSATWDGKDHDAPPPKGRKKKG